VARLTTALTLLGSALLAACGAEAPTGEASDPATAPGLLRACELLTLAEADPGGILGLQPMRTPVDISEGRDAAKCSYATQQPPFDIVALEVRRYPNAGRAAGAQRGAAGFLPSLSGVDNVAVSGVGDEALWAGGRLGQLHARSGTLRLIVTVEAGTSASRADRARAVATRAVERLTSPRLTG
jgi:hypothetical protein